MKSVVTSDHLWYWRAKTNRPHSGQGQSLRKWWVNPKISPPHTLPYLLCNPPNRPKWWVGRSRLEALKREIKCDSLDEQERWWSSPDCLRVMRRKLSGIFWSIWKKKVMKHWNFSTGSCEFCCEINLKKELKYENKNKNIKPKTTKWILQFIQYKGTKKHGKESKQKWQQTRMRWVHQNSCQARTCPRQQQRDIGTGRRISSLCRRRTHRQYPKSEMKWKKCNEKWNAAQCCCIQ